MNNGESAWIEGYALFSPFVVFIGSYKLTENFTNPKNLNMKSHDLYNCSVECKRGYIGIHNASCYCMGEDKPSFTRSQPYRNISIPCLGNTLEDCSGISFISIYRLVSSGEGSWDRKDSSHRQCVIAEKGVKRFKLSTASCFAKVIDGYLCTITDTARCSSGKMNNTNCLMHQNTTRMEAFSGCLNETGTLIDLYGEVRSLNNHRL